MQRAMRRKKQQLDDDATVQIMKEGSFGVLALAGTDGDPYAVPLNYVYVDESLDPSWVGPSIYFHVAKDGHKLDIIEQNPRASFCVVAEHEVIPDRFATDYRSAIAFGILELVEHDIAHDALYALGDKYNPGAVDAIEHEIASDGPRCFVLELRIETLTGKRSSISAALSNSGDPIREALNDD